MKKFMLIIWKAICVYVRINTLLWASIGFGTWLFNSNSGKEWYEWGDPDKGADLTIRRAIKGQRKFGKFIWYATKEIVGYIADEIRGI